MGRNGHQTLELVIWNHVVRAVIGSSQMLVPVLPFPFESVVRGVKVVTSRDGVREDEVI